MRKILGSYISDLADFTAQNWRICYKIPVLKFFVENSQENIRDGVQYFTLVMLHTAVYVSLKVSQI